MVTQEICSLVLSYLLQLSRRFFQTSTHFPLKQQRLLVSIIVRGSFSCFVSSYKSLHLALEILDKNATKEIIEDFEIAWHNVFLADFFLFFLGIFDFSFDPRLLTKRKKYLRLL